MNPWEIHPALVHLPIGLLLSSTVLDIAAVVRGRESLSRVAFGLLVAGVITALVAAAAGVLAFFTVPAHSAEAHRRIFIHLSLAVCSAVIFAIEILVRWKRRGELARPGHLAASIVAAAALFAAGSFGGQLVYHDGVGVTAVQSTDSQRE